MTYEHLLALPDSKEKFNALEKMPFHLKLQYHTATYYRALEEYRRLFKIYRPAR